jgi:hypothetical protein
MKGGKKLKKKEKASIFSVGSMSMAISSHNLARIFALKKYASDEL